MDRKKLLIPILIAAVAVVLLTVSVLTGRDEPGPSGTVPTKPDTQSQTTPTLPDQTVPRDDAGTVPTEATEPEQTEPDQTEPDLTEPEQTEPKYTEPEQTEPDQTDPAVEVQSIFPVELEAGDLTVLSLFQFTGMNPDAENKFGEDIAGIEMTNNTDRHMTYAEVTAIMADGTALTFRAEDVPAGGTVMAFSPEHASVKDVNGCEEVYGYAEFDNSDPMRTDLVECTVDGIAITVRNVSGTDLTNLDLICHGLLDSSYFGGTIYHYHVSTLPAGSSTVVYAVDCILGMTQVVRVEIGS